MAISVPYTLTLNLWQPLKDGKFTCLYIICKSFILNANLIDQVTPGGRDKHQAPSTHTHTLIWPSRHPPFLSLSLARLPPPPPHPYNSSFSVVGSKRWVEWQPTLSMANWLDTHKTEVRPVSTGVWRPAEVPCLCIVFVVVSECCY